MEKPATEKRGQWLSSRCNRGLFGVQFRQGSWFIHACFTDRCAKLAEHARYGHRRDVRGACVVQLSRRACWHVLPDGLRCPLYVGIQHLPRRAGVTKVHCLRQASSPKDMSFFCVAHAGCSSIPASRSLRQCTHDSAACFCMAIPFWSLSLAGRREMGVHPTVTDGRASSFATCPARPVSLCASIGVGVWPIPNLVFWGITAFFRFSVIQHLLWTAYSSFRYPFLGSRRCKGARRRDLICADACLPFPTDSGQYGCGCFFWAAFYWRQLLNLFTISAVHLFWVPWDPALSVDGYSEQARASFLSALPICTRITDSDTEVR